MIPWDKLPWDSVGGGLIFLTATILAALGIKRTAAPSAPPPTPPPSAPAGGQLEMVGALLDAKRMDLLIQELGVMSTALHALRPLADDHNKRIDRNTNAIDEHREAIEENARHAKTVSERTEELARELRETKSETRDLREELRRMSRDR